MKKILIVFTILFLFVWIYSSRKETFKLNTLKTDIKINYVFNTERSIPVRTITIQGIKDMTQLSDVYNALEILEYEYDWIQTEDDLAPDFKDTSLFKTFKNDTIKTDKIFFFVRQVNRTIIVQELVNIFNDINDAVNNRTITQLININKINNHLDIDTSVGILKPLQNSIIDTNIVKKILDAYKMIFKIPTFTPQERREMTKEFYKTDITIDNIIKLIQENTILKNDNNKLNKIAFNLSFPNITSQYDNTDWPQTNQEDYALINIAVSSILKQYKHVEQFTGHYRDVFFINDRNKILLISYLLYSDLKLQFLPYKSKTTQSPSTTTSPLTTLSPKVSITTTSSPNSYVLDHDSNDFVRDMIILLDAINNNYEAIFEDLFIDIILFPKLIGKIKDDRARDGASIFKKMISDALAEYEKKYVFVSPDSLGLEIPDYLDKKHIFPIPKEKKDIEYKIVKKLNHKAKEEQLKKKQFRKFDIKKIPLNFSKILIDIMDDMIKLYSKEHFDNMNELTTLWEKWKYYSTNTFMILTDNGRMFYVGVFFFIISILVYFSDLF